MIFLINTDRPHSPCLTFDGSSAQVILYPCISKLRSFGRLLESKYVLDKHIMSSTLYALRREIFENLSARMLFKLRWQTE